MDMGIVNAGQLAIYDDIPEDLKNRVEDAVLNRRDDATERLLTIAEKYQGDGSTVEKKKDLNGESGQSTSGLNMRWSMASQILSSKTQKKPARPLIVLGSD